MPKRIEIPLAPEPLEAYAEHFDDLLGKSNQREAFRRSLEGLLLVRSDQAIRHWQLVCCAFSFCWYHASHPSTSSTQETRVPSEPEASLQTSVPAEAAGTGKKISEAQGMRPQLSWPVAWRAVRAWLEPWIMRSALVERLVIAAPTSCHPTTASVP